ncbi:peptidoglycan DD-metalloendopeptidase family protein [Corynebacterium glucuronolyticum]|uniref:peptidoglycan DD-metalloendopeptidase family protein n=1 Tax=Corynebacterium glucuronolyticum TaxID=39791 RepID=UPI001E51E2F8|nr:peptidoglycan DD-metalloendopeptidase family protein [Corynebacterium glucuronolyticum]
MDLAAPHGTPIYAVADGVVVQGRERPQGSVAGFGSWIWIDCQASVGRDFIYGHVHHPGILVQAGDRVRAGQQIGVVGNEGQSTGPHLHFEEWTAPGRLGGRAVDPAGWVASHPSPGATASIVREDSVTIFGIDISDHQRGFDLARAKAEGVEFAILRLCDGTYVDRSFREHLAGAERAGLLVSTYWYLRAPSEGTSISQQVDVIDRQMGGRRDLGVWIDVESIPAGVKTLTGEHVREAKRELERRGYRVAGVYSGAWYWEAMPGGEPSMDGLGHLWVSNYGSNRKGSYRTLYEGDGGDQHRGWSYPLGDRKPDILQYGSEATVAGHYPVDVNAYRGTSEQLAAIFTGTKPAEREEEEMADSKMISDIFDQLAGPGRDEKGKPTYNGWDEDTIRENARTRESGGKTLIELVALTRAEVHQLAEAVAALATAIKEEHQNA